MKSLNAALVWLRRDLRCDDHAALYHALRDCRRVWCVFVFDRDILDRLPNPHDRRVEFVHDSVVQLDGVLRAAGGGLIAVHAHARTEIPRLAAMLQVDAVFANRDYEPAARARDAAIAEALHADGRMLVTFKDQAIFDRNELLTAAGRPYTVFTPYRNAWQKKLGDADLAAYPVDCQLDALAPPPAELRAVPTLESMGFSRTNLHELPLGVGTFGADRLLAQFVERLHAYHDARDLPAVRGSSLLSVHLRFGTISPRRLARVAVDTIRAQPADAEGAQTWLSELTWRDFFFQMLYHLPHVVDRACRPVFDAVRFDDAPDLLEAWKQGRTGYPLVDAGMRELATTGFMHNRVRMVTASFLVKQLGIDWRLGERHFAETLNDYDLSANVGNWQWVASTGCDAQPWFRIFNPVTQSEKFDRAGRYIRQHVPQLARLPDRAIHAPWRADAQVLAAAGVQLGTNYPLPVVDLDQARERTLARYSVVKRPASDPSTTAGQIASSDT